MSDRRGDSLLAGRYIPENPLMELTGAADRWERVTPGRAGSPLTSLGEVSPALGPVSLELPWGSAGPRWPLGGRGPGQRPCRKDSIRCG